MIRTLVTGYGYWGRVLTRNLLEHPAFFVAGVHDPNAWMRQDAMAHHNLYAFSNLDEAIRETLPDLVVIASPIETMLDAAMMSLDKYAHVMIAKPGATNMQECESLIALALEREVSVTTDYTMLMSPRIEELRSEIDKLGGLVEATFVRDSVGSRSSAPILLDMMVHDLAIACGLHDHWRVESSGTDDQEGVIKLASDSSRAVATLLADRDATTPRRLCVLECDYGTTYWNQLDDASTMTLVHDRLSSVAKTITNRGEGNADMMRRVSALLEAAA